MNPERAMEEFGRELEHLSEDIECWWASRSPETSCAKWERWAAQEECDMRMDGSRWNWEEQWCMDRDSVYNFEYSRCMDDMSEGVDEWGCSADWYENEWYDETDPWSQRGWCNWQCENSEDKLVLAKDIKMTKDSGLTSYLTHFAKNDSKKMHAIRMLQSMDSEMTISVDLDLAELESIGLENEAVM